MLKRFHPVSVVTCLPKFSYIVLVPVIQKIFGGEIQAIERQWFFALFLILVLSVCLYLSQGWKIEKSILHYNRGILHRLKHKIYLQKSSCIEISDSPFYRVFAAKNFSVRMMKKSKKSFTAVLSNRQTAEIISSLNPGRLKPICKISVGEALLSSLFGTNAYLGLLIGAPLVNRIGKYTGERLQAQVVERWNETLDFFARFLPPFFAFAALLMIMGWLFAVFHSALRYMQTSVFKNDKFLVTQGGIWRRTTRFFPLQNIQGFLVCETPLMRADGYCRLYAVSGTPEKTPGEFPVILPIVKRNKILTATKYFNKLPKNQQYRVFTNLFWQFCAIFAISVIALYFFPMYKNEIFIILNIFLGVYILFLWGKKLQLKSGGAADNSAAVVRGITRWSIYSSPAALKENVLIQNCYQRRAGVCRKGMKLGGAEKIKVAALCRSSFESLQSEHKKSPNAKALSNFWWT